MIAIGLFYVLRDVVQKVWFIEKPPGYLWDYPGVLSIFVGYGKSADFFFSGHLGVCVLNYCEFMANKMEYWAYFCLFSLAMQTFLMIVLRSHYSIDMIAGVIIAHYIFIQSDKYAYIAEWYIFGTIPPPL